MRAMKNVLNNNDAECHISLIIIFAQGKKHLYDMSDTKFLSMNDSFMCENVWPESQVDGTYLTKF